MASPSKAVLFGPYSYGMTMDAVRACGQLAPQAQGLTLEGATTVDFLHLQWEETFYFNNLHQLQEVILTRPGANVEDCLALLTALSQDAWQPVAVESEDGVFDLLEASATGDAATAQAQLREYVQKNLQPGSSITVTCFPTDYAQHSLQTRKFKGWLEALDKAPQTFRTLTLMVGNDHTRLAFGAPLLSRKNALRYGQMIKR